MPNSMLKNLFRRIPLAWRQVTREKTRLTVAIAGIAFADLLMFIQLGLKDALYDSVSIPYQNLQGDVFLINPLFESLNVIQSFPRERLYQAAGVEGVDSFSSLYIGSGEWRNPQNQTNQATLIWGIDPGNSAITLPEIQPHLSELQLLDRVLYDRAGRDDLFGHITQQLQETNPLTIQLNDKTVQVIGTFALGASFAADGNLIVGDSTFLRLFPDRKANQIDIGLLTLKPGTDIEQVKAMLQANLPDDVRVLTHDELVEHEKAFWQTNSPIGFIFGLGAIIGFVVGVVIVYQILYSDVSDHLPEYATLKAMGYSDRYLINVLLQEALILAALGFVPGLLLSTGLYFVAASATLLPIGMTANRAGIVLGLTIVMCAASGAVAMRKLQAADPADIF